MSHHGREDDDYASVRACQAAYWDGHRDGRAAAEAAHEARHEAKGKSFRLLLLERDELRLKIDDAMDKIDELRGNA